MRIFAIIKRKRQDTMKNQMMSEHFSLKEFTDSATAEKFHINNTPDKYALEGIRTLCREVLEPLRKAFGPVFINSGYRCRELNRRLHGVGLSQHLVGEAADLRIANEDIGRQYFDFLLTHCTFDQLLFEHSRFGRIWLHVSCKHLPAHNRRMAIRNMKTNQT